MFVIELVLFDTTGWDDTGENLLNMLDVDEVGDDVGLFEETDEAEGGHLLVLQLYLAM